MDWGLNSCKCHPTVEWSIEDGKIAMKCKKIVPISPGQINFRLHRCTSTTNRQFCPRFSHFDPGWGAGFWNFQYNSSVVEWNSIKVFESTKKKHKVSGIPTRWTWVTCAYLQRTTRLVSRDTKHILILRSSCSLSFKTSRLLPTKQTWTRPQG